MNESGYIRSVHKKLEPEIDTWKINDNYAGGVADAYYDGNGGMLFVEYKYLKQLPKRASTIIVPALSKLQVKWLKRRYERGIPACVILGSPEGSIVFVERSWEKGISAEVFRNKAITTPQVADVIWQCCRSTPTDINRHVATFRG